MEEDIEKEALRKYFNETVEEFENTIAILSSTTKYSQNLDLPMLMTAVTVFALNVSKNRLVISMMNLRMSGKLFIAIINISL